MASAPPQIALGIIGCGRATQQHLPALARAASVRVVAVADTDRERLDRTASRFAIPARYSDARELFNVAGLDAVAICTPIASHAELALAALAAGKHVFVEKPLALAVAEGERLVAAAKASSQVTALGFNLRCHRLVRRAREMIASGALGNVHQIVSTWSSGLQHDPMMPEWRRSFATGGGALFEIGTHHIDAAAFLLKDRVSSVQSLGRSGTCEDESVSLLARTDGNVLISSSFSQVTSAMNEFRIVGDKGALWFSLYRADSFVFSERARPRVGLRGRLDRMMKLRELPELFRVARGGGDFFMSYREQWRRFAAAILEQGAPASSFADGLEALKVIQAAKASQEAGQATIVAA